jgi:hypothetical protein
MVFRGPARFNRLCLCNDCRRRSVHDVSYPADPRLRRRMFRLLHRFLRLGRPLANRACCLAFAWIRRFDFLDCRGILRGSHDVRANVSQDHGNGSPRLQKYRETILIPLLVSREPLSQQLPKIFQESRSAHASQVPAVDLTQLRVLSERDRKAGPRPSRGPASSLQKSTFSAN